jgi:pyridinium-3,5-bisthiocarboxylic acid mononucleotide nickel chelatase
VTTLLYLDVTGGLAGDMLLAALLDAGAPAERLHAVPEALGVGPVRIEVARVSRQGVGALHVEVTPPPDPPPRTWRQMRELISRAEIPDRARQRALDALFRLADAEASIHGRPVDDVHFHELGGVDTLVDLCGAAVLVEALGVRRVVCSPVPFVRGQARAAHGVLPLPAPATLAVLRGAQLEGRGGGKEIVTPTGAALAASLAESFGPLPLLELERVGYGAGTDDPPDRANVLRVLVGRLVETAPRDVVLLEANLDDMSPELLPDAVVRCLDAGALDVWTAPAQMKKGRPGFVLAALARPGAEGAVAAAILEETTTLGVRVSGARRYELDREERAVEIAGGIVRVKVGRLDGRVVNVAPEHDDCSELARRTGRAVKDVWAEALVRAREIV